jgi:prolyl-tRNA synthetase
MRTEFEKYYAVTDDKFNKSDFEKRVLQENRLITKGIEVGHIFYFGDKYSEPLNAKVDLQGGKKISVKMGSYGIGVSRLVAAIIEAKFNNNIMKWPISVSPFEVAIIPMISKNDNSSLTKSQNIYKELIKHNIDVLLDDTDENISAKIKKFNLIGIPYQIIIGQKSKDDLLEFKEIDKMSQNLTADTIIQKLIKEKSSI